MHWFRITVTDNKNSSGVTLQYLTPLTIVFGTITTEKVLRLVLSLLPQLNKIPFERERRLTVFGTMTTEKEPRLVSLLTVEIKCHLKEREDWQ